MSSLQARRLEDERSHAVGVHVGRRAAVLEVPLAVNRGLVADAHGAPAVRDAVRELFDARRLVRASEALMTMFSKGFPRKTSVQIVPRGPLAMLSYVYT